MPEPTLQQVFGANATQTANLLTISKADLATVGLTASATNTAESLFVAIYLLQMQYLNADNQNSNPDIQITTAESFQSITTRNNQQYRQRSFTTSLEQLEAVTTIDPDNY